MKAYRYAVLAMATLLAACGNGEEGRAAAQATAPVASENTAAGASRVPPESRDPTGMLTLAPGAIDLCVATEGAIAMDVTWNATQANTDGIKIFLTDPATGEEKLWLAAPAQGTDKTGPWMREGTLVRLVDANANADLAKLTVTSVPCAK